MSGNTKYFASRLRPTTYSPGGVTSHTDSWIRLDRLLVRGSEGGTFYIGELSIENANAVVECLAEDGVRVINRLLELTESGRAPRNDPALFVLAMAAALGDDVTRGAAFEALPKVAGGRIIIHNSSTHEPSQAVSRRGG